jgi:hypothetical protein
MRLLDVNAVPAICYVSLYKIESMINDLILYREDYKDSNPKHSFQGVPFLHSKSLFATSLLVVRDRYGMPAYPCTAFGKHLVHKIVDELLDAELVAAKKTEHDPARCGCTYKGNVMWPY